MKVLMLGWEFPPHLTGGLGTACRGLSRGLARAGVELTFVVPRLFGDEDAGWMELVGAAPEGEPGGPDRSPVRIEHRALPSGLAPYRPVGREALSPTGRTRLAALPGWERPSLPATAGGWRALAERVADAVAGGPSGADAPVDDPLVRAAREAGPFRGGYGPELFGEVARYALRVAELARERGADLVHAHDWMTFPAGLAAARVLGVPFVAHVHSTEYDRAGDWPDERVLAVERAGLEAADRIVTVSEFAARRLVTGHGVDPARIEVVHNSVERRERPATRPARAAVASPPTVLFLGRVTRQKGPDLLLEAARRVVERRPEVRFVVAGDGDLLPHTVRRAAAEGLAENVLYTGFLAPERVPEVFARVDLFVLPSVSEPFGIAALEAVDAGLPVLVSSASGVGEVLTSAPRFDPDDAEGLAAAILDALGDDARRAALVAAARADLARSSWDASGARLAATFDALAAVGAGGGGTR